MRVRSAAPMRIALVAALVVASGCSPRRASDSASKQDREPGAKRTSSAARWRPAPGTSWQWQLVGEIDDSLPVDMYDVDLFDAPDAVLFGLRGRGVKIICYFSAGTHENWRPDVGSLPGSVIGEPLDEWPGERWLDIRASEVRALAIARLDRAKQRGCDGVEPDNVDGYTQRTGFPLTADDQLAFNRFLAREAHARNLSVGLKNDVDQAAALEPHFDWALVEECMQYAECDRLAPFIAAGKAVFHVEYGDAALAARVCPDANARDFDTLIKNKSLDRFRIACR